MADRIMDSILNINKWQDNKKAKNEDFIKQGNLCKVEIITETIKPISFLF